MRRVMVSEYRKQAPPHSWRMEEKGVAIFHTFGNGYAEFETGAGNFSTAIIEWPDGTVDNVPVQHVRFLDGLAPEDPGCIGGSVHDYREEGRNADGGVLLRCADCGREVERTVSNV